MVVLVTDIETIQARSGPDALITVAWNRDAQTYRICGRVTLEPGVGQHVVDVTDPAAPCLMSSPSMKRWLHPTILATDLTTGDREGKVNT
jgi:hypothetical protein